MYYGQYTCSFYTRCRRHRHRAKIVYHKYKKETKQLMKNIKHSTVSAPPGCPSNHKKIPRFDLNKVVVIDPNIIFWYI